jgi:hypothetical protein
MKKHWEKYVSTLNADKELLDVYRDLRAAFQREGWTDKDLEKPPYYPNDIMRNFQNFSTLQNKLFFELKSFFVDVDHNDFTDYLKDKLKIIDSETPLTDGNNKRRDSWDEDY